LQRKTAIILTAVAGVIVVGFAYYYWYYYLPHGGGGGGAISLQITPSSLGQGATLTWSATGLTPNGECQALICFGTNFAQCLDLMPHPIADATGKLLSYSVTIGTNVPPGSCMFIIKDLTTGQFAQQPFSVVSS
jgi:hypothetical protein